MKQFIIQIPLYAGKIHFAINCTEEDAVSFFNKKYDIDTECNGYTGFHIPIQNISNGNWTNLIFIRNFDWCIDDMITVIHELLHASINILDRSGVPINKENQECITYLHDALCGLSFKQLEPAKKKNSKK